MEKKPVEKTNNMEQSFQKMIETFLRPLIKKIIRSDIYRNTRNILLKRKVLAFLKNEIIRDNSDGEKNTVYTFLEKNPLSMYPYEFIKKYKPESIKVYTDNECGMKYVLHENKRLYFGASLTEKQIRKYYNQCLMEQDIDSPHRYEYSDFKVNVDDVVVDIGVAEGNFALSVVERVKKLYLFETDALWIDALNKTFEPWKDKVVIINKYVSDVNTDKEVSADVFFADCDVNFLKIDVEGGEMKVLRGAHTLFTNQNKLKISVCTYHRQDDAKNIDNYLMSNQFLTEFSKGYMICDWDRKLSAPWLRKGLIRAEKSDIFPENPA